MRLPEESLEVLNLMFGSSAAANSSLRLFPLMAGCTLSSKGTFDAAGERSPRLAAEKICVPQPNIWDCGVFINMNIWDLTQIHEL